MSMECEQYIALMSDYMEGDLSEEDCALWKAHFSGCQPCADFFGSFRSSVDLVKHLRSEGCPKEIADRVRSIISQRAQQKSDRRCP